MAKTVFHSLASSHSDGKAYIKQIYNLKVVNKENNRVSYFIKNCSDGTAHFTAPASKKGNAKIYVISDDCSIIYVGMTTQGMAQRLNMGLNATGTNGYHGYKWKDVSLLALNVFTFPNFEDSQFLETIEAEIVFLCRSNLSQWPSGQTEIHFHCSTDEHKHIANCIYTDINVSIKNRASDR